MAQYSVSRGNHYGSSNRDIHEVVMLADKNGNVLNSFGSASNIPIAAGDVSGYSHINKFGYTGGTSVSTGTIWDGNTAGQFYPYPAAGVVTVTSSDTANDNGETVEIQGLDSNYNPAIETVTVGGAAGATSFIRIFRARMVSNTNVGIITINQGGSLAAQISAGNGQTLMAVYTIPAGKTGYLLKFQGSMDKSNADTIFKLFSRPWDNGAFNLKGQWGTQGGNPVTYDYPVPLVFTEKTDIKVDIAAGNVGAGAIFDIILVDNV